MSLISGRTDVVLASFSLLVRRLASLIDLRDFLEERVPPPARKPIGREALRHARPIAVWPGASHGD